MYTFAWVKASKPYLMSSEKNKAFTIDSGHSLYSNATPCPIQLSSSGIYAN